MAKVINKETLGNLTRLDVLVKTYKAYKDGYPVNMRRAMYTFVDEYEYPREEVNPDIDNRNTMDNVRRYNGT